MFENLTLIAALAIIFWIISFVVYGIISSRQRELEKDIRALRDRLDQSNS